MDRGRAVAICERYGRRRAGNQQRSIEYRRDEDGTGIGGSAYRDHRPIRGLHQPYVDADDATGSADRRQRRDLGGRIEAQHVVHQHRWHQQHGTPDVCPIGRAVSIVQLDRGNPRQRGEQHRRIRRHQRHHYDLQERKQPIPRRRLRESGKYGDERAQPVQRNRSEAEHERFRLLPGWTDLDTKTL